MTHIAPYPSRRSLDTDDWSDAQLSIFDVTTSPVSLMLRPNNDTNVLSTKYLSHVESEPTKQGKCVTKSEILHQLTFSRKDLLRHPGVGIFSTQNVKHKNSNMSSTTAPPKPKWRPRKLTTPGRESLEVLKIVVSFKGEVSVLRLRKVFLSTTRELIDVTLWRLAQKYGLDKAEVRLALAFPDKSLKPVSLLPDDSLLAPFFEEFCMEYVRSKSRIAVIAESKKNSEDGNIPLMVAQSQ